MTDVYVTKEIPVYLPTSDHERVVVGKASVQANATVLIEFDDEGGRVKELLQEDWLIGISFDFLAAEPVNLHILKEK